MIAASDRIDLAEGVVVSNARLVDAVRASSWPLNSSGVFILERAAHRLDVVVRELAEAFDLPPDVARFDALQFVWTLNRLALVNVVQSGTRFRRMTEWLGLALRLAPAGALPTPITRRRPLDTRGALSGFASSFMASATRVVTVAAASTVALLPLAVLAGDPARSSALALAFGLAAGLGVGLHEAGHTASLRGVPSALVTRGRRTYVLHAPVEPARRSLVAVAGPALAATTGLVLVLLGGAISDPAIVSMGLPLAAHALALTVVAGDGRAACGM